MNDVSGVLIAAPVRRAVEVGRPAGPARRRARWPVPLIAVLAVLPLYVLWVWLLATGGGDLAAQFAWAGFADRHPGSPYNLAWYGGMHTMDYSVLTPPLMAYAGVRTVTVAAGLVSTWAMAALSVGSGIRRPLVPALLGAVCLWCDVASGRTTFALGVAFGLLAMVWAQRTPLPWAGTAAWAALTALSSPIAALFLWVVGAGHLVAGRRWGTAAALGVPPLVVMGSVALLFPFQGEQLMNGWTMVMPLIVCGALTVAAPRPWRTVRAGAVVYALGTVVTAWVASPVGTNVERLAEIGGLPLLGAALGERCEEWARLRRARRELFDFWQPGSVLALALLPVLASSLVYDGYWVARKTVSDLRVSTSVPAWASHTQGVIGALSRLHADRHRVEVVPARDHREATALAPFVDMARGWNRQLDVERGRLFYRKTLSATSYRSWLDDWAVGYVVVPHGRIDGPAQHEAAVVAGRPGWLRPVWHDPYWTVLAVTRPVPLASAPASVVRAGEADVVVHLPAAGSTVLRVVYSPWLTAKGACIRPAGRWTRVTTRAGGDYRVGAGYSLWPGGGCG